MIAISGFIICVSWPWQSTATWTTASGWMTLVSWERSSDACMDRKGPISACILNGKNRLDGFSLSRSWKLPVQTLNVRKKTILSGTYFPASSSSFLFTQMVRLSLPVFIPHQNDFSLLVRTDHSRLSEPSDSQLSPQLYASTLQARRRITVFGWHGRRSHVSGTTSARQLRQKT
jgi:hypothetical protein